jgi:hypothetical protein
VQRLREKTGEEQQGQVGKGKWARASGQGQVAKASGQRQAGKSKPAKAWANHPKGALSMPSIKALIQAFMDE